MQYLPFKFNPNKHFRVKLALYYDNEFLKNVGKGSHTAAKKEMSRIVHLAKTYFHGWGTDGNKLQSRIDLDVVHRGHLSENLVLKSSDGDEDAL